jgi:Protein of unknown function (DUF3810)
LSAFKQYIWVVLAAATLLLHNLAQTHPAWTERYYTNGFFRIVRWVFDVGLGWLPFPAAYLLFGFVGWRLARGLWFLARNDTFTPLQKLGLTGSTLLVWISAIVTLFYWLWGFNYSRIPLEQQLGLPAVTMDTALLRSIFEVQTEKVLALRAVLQPDTAQGLATKLPADMEAAVRATLVAQLKALGLPHTGSPRGRQPFWRGFLIRFGALGIYNPFTGECNVDAGNHDLTKPVHFAHEFCHGYGFGDEGVCNFLAYIALEQSDVLLYRYAAELDYWRELAGAYRRTHPDAYVTRWRTLPVGFRHDLEQIRAAIQRYPEFFERFRYRAYNQYLKAQGIREGMANYGKVIPLVAAYRQKTAQYPPNTTDHK